MKSSMNRIAVFVAVALAATGLYAQQAKTIRTGITTVVPASSFVSNLHSLGITLGVVGPSEMDDGGISFPMTGGVVDLITASAQGIHSGGLTLTAGATEVRLQSLIIDTTGPELFITGLVVIDNKLIGRMPLFDLQPPNGVLLPLIPNKGGVLKVNGLGLTLTVAAAGALNTAFNTTVLQPHMEVGMANVIAMLSHPPDADDPNDGENGDHNADHDGHSSHPIQLHHDHEHEQGHE